MELEKILLEYSKKGFELSIVKELKSGKDADLYLVSQKVAALEQNLVLKLYKSIDKVSLNRFNPYLEGRKFSGSFGRATQKRTNRGVKFLADLRIKREFNLLTKIYKSTQNIPKPIFQAENSILMEYIGDNQSPAPRLNDILLSESQAQTALQQVFGFLDTLLDLDLVHGDFSEFNILYFKDTIFVIDFPQALEISVNPNWEKLLNRDIENSLHYFKKYFDKESLQEIRQKFNLRIKSIKEALIYAKH
jgi:RIO kinase 1